VAIKQNIEGVLFLWLGMKAVWYERYGAAKDVLKFGDVRDPEVGKGEVLVRVSFSGVNPADEKRRKGILQSPIQGFGMIIPHNDGAGVIEKVGEGVPSSRVGERVWVYEAAMAKRLGTAAEFVALPQEQAVPLPSGASFESGASLGTPAMTAHRCVFSGGPVKGQTILVSGGAGAVGNDAIQLAKWGGARVITTVGSPEGAAVASKAGADHVVNHRTEDVVQRVREITGAEEGEVDRVVEVELGGNLKQDVSILKPQGVIASYASDAVGEPIFPFYTLFANNPVFQLVYVYTMSGDAHRTAISDINSCLESGALIPNIGKVYALSETVQAHEAVENGSVVGKVLVRIRDSSA
jgi:NADPH2:quinone reductase